MHRPLHRTLRLIGLAAWIGLLCAGFLGVTSQVQAAKQNPGGLFLYLHPENDRVPYACVGKPITGTFRTGLDDIDSDVAEPLWQLTPPDIVVNADGPRVGTLSRTSWTIHSFNEEKYWTYTPTKPGDEQLVFKSRIPQNPSYATVTQSAWFPVINCRYRLSIHGEIKNAQGGIDTNMFYDAEGHFDLTKKNKDSSFVIRGFGVTSIEAFSDGTEGDVRCITSEPGKGAGSLRIQGESDASSNLNLTLRFGDTATGVPQTCTKDGKSRPWGVRKVGFLPSGDAEGVLADLEFPPLGGNLELGVGGAVNDRRWIQGATTGDLLITVVPVTSK